MKYLFTVLILVLQLFFSFNATAADVSVPDIPNDSFYVQDYAKVLSPETIKHINKTGKELREKTKAQICVVTVSTLGEKPIKEYANELFRKWGIGDSKLNNGILLLVAVNDRRARIEVGYGLEGAIPDSVAGNILREDIFPHFKKGDFDKGILTGYNKLLDKTVYEYKVKLESDSSAGVESLLWGLLGIALLSVLPIAGIALLYTWYKDRQEQKKYNSSRSKGRGKSSSSYDDNDRYRRYSDSSSYSSDSSDSSDSGGGGSSGGGGADDGW